MRKPCTAVLSLFAIVLLSLCASPPVRAADKPADFSGSWKWTAQTRNTPTDFTMKLMQEGDKVTGTVTGMNNQKSEIKEGKVANGELSFKVVRDRNGTSVATTYTGKLEGDSIKGKIETTGGATTRPARDWTATRVKADAGAEKKEGAADAPK